MYGGRGSEGAGGSGSEIRQYGGARLCLALNVYQEDFELNTELNQEPVELLEDRSDVVDGGGSCYDAGN